MLLNPTDSTYPKSAPGLLIYTPINFIENVPLGAKDSFGSKLKKILSWVPEESFSFYCIRCCSYSLK